MLLAAIPTIWHFYLYFNVKISFYKDKPDDYIKCTQPLSQRVSWESKKTKGLTKADKWKSRLRLLATKLIKDCLSLQWYKWKPETLLWANPSRYTPDCSPLKLTQLKSDFFAWIMHYSRTEGRPLRLWLMVQEKAEGTICTMHMGSHHSWTRREAHGGGYLQRWRCSSKTHGAHDANNCADPLMCLSVAFVPLTSKPIDLIHHN